MGPNRAILEKSERDESPPTGVPTMNATARKLPEITCKSCRLALGM